MQKSDYYQSECEWRPRTIIIINSQIWLKNCFIL